MLTPVNRKIFSVLAMVVLFILVDYFVPVPSESDTQVVSEEQTSKRKIGSKGPTMAELSRVDNQVSSWPPKLGQSFPDVALMDQYGAEFRLSSLQGKPILLEMVAMPCGGCQAWSGGNIYGAFDGHKVQRELKSIEEYYQSFTKGRSLFSNEIYFVQLVIYNSDLLPPKPEELKAWSEHFRFNQHENTFIVGGGDALANKESFKRIPGFYLLDSNLIVRYDSAGHNAPNNLYQDLLSNVNNIIRESAGG